MSLIMNFTAWQRYRMAKKYILDSPDLKLLDVGCGNMKFCNSFKNLKCNGFDLEEGGAEYVLPQIPKESYDYITMLAVIEHLDDSSQAIAECLRILKNGGLLIITTPLEKAERYIKYYNKNVGKDHKAYYSNKDFLNIQGLDLIRYKTFDLGLNQLIVLEKTPC